MLCLTILLSQIAYNYAAIINCAQIAEWVQKGKAVLQEPISDEIAGRICESFLKTPHFFARADRRNP